jgi:hypothetical protein
MSLTSIALPAKLALSVPEFVLATGISERSTLRAIADKSLRAFWTCGRWRILPSDAERFIEGLPPLPGTEGKPKVRQFASR